MPVVEIETRVVCVNLHVDDKGNPPPPYLEGDMIPKFYNGRWWVCWSDYVGRCEEKGDKP